MLTAVNWRKPPPKIFVALSAGTLQDETGRTIGEAGFIELADTGETASPIASAADNPFQLESLKSGYQIAGVAKGEDSDKGSEAKCGGDKDTEAKCGEAKCGGSN